MKTLTLANKNDFTLELALTLIDSIQEDTQPLWGRMTAQHMLEHIGLTVGGSIGKVTIKVFTPEEKISIYKEKGLFTDTPWKQGIESPALRDTLPDLYYSSFLDAKESLKHGITAYFTLYEKNPSIKFPNPAFGILTLEEWRQFHFKHFRHHFTQFGVL